MANWIEKTLQNIEKTANSIGIQGEQGPVGITYRVAGKQKDSLFAVEGKHWKDALDVALRELASRHDLSNTPKDTILEINLTHGYERLQKGTLPAERARGLNGIIFAWGEHSWILTPSEMIAKNLSFERARARFLEQLKEAGTLPPAASEIAPHRFEAIQLLVPLPEGEITVLYRGAQIVPLEAVNKTETAAFAERMATWMMANCSAEGELTYKYWPSRGNSSEAVNLIRLFMGVLCMFQMAYYYRKPEMREAAKHALAYQLKLFYHQEGELGYVLEEDKVKLGACALAALAIEAQYQPGTFSVEREALFATTQHLWRDTGEFRTFLKPDDRNDCQNFYPGETLLYWVARWLDSRDEALLEKIKKSFVYYRDFFRRESNPAFVPWHTQAYYLLWRETQDDALRDFIFEMNDFLVPVQQWDDAKCPDFKGRFYDPKRPFGPPHASSTGVYIEGLADAYSLAREVGDEKRAKTYAVALIRGIRSSMQLQFKDDVDMYYISKKDKVFGGLRTTEYNNEIRIDNVQHTLMGVLKVLGSGLFSHYSAEDAV